MHALVLFLVLGPIVATSDFIHEPSVGGGGPGPAGGGGGGSGGVASRQERLEFIRMRPPPAPAANVQAPVVPPVKPPPKPEVEAAVTPLPAAIAPVVTPTPGQGAGNAGTPGSGPGTGGGVGSGVGTGRGSAVGPGTGGGPGTDYPPTLRDLFIPPLPAPARIKPYHLIAWFDVDEKGTARLLGFNPSKDGGYNKRLTEVLRSLRFRPGVHADGTPMRDTVDVHFIF